MAGTSASSVITRGLCALFAPLATAHSVKGGTREAHEAIRPTDVARSPEQVSRFLDADELRLYELIWKRTLASQMASASMIGGGSGGGGASAPPPPTAPHFLALFSR